jgi:hypothetical protein
MSEDRDWTYYQFDSPTKAFPVVFFRTWRGVTDRLDQRKMTWVSLETDALSRRIENGEVGLDETTRAAIETAVGFTLPA